MEHTVPSGRIFAFVTRVYLYYNYFILKKLRRGIGWDYSFFLEGVFVCGWIFDFSRYQHWHIVISWFNNNLVILDDRISVFFFFKE